MTDYALVKPDHIHNLIHTLRGVQIMLDADLAQLYAVSIKRLNEQVRRNAARFPKEFMFQLTADEHDSLRSQFATLETGRGKHRKYRPYAFTEQGVAMLSAVLRSETAVRTSIKIMQAFVAMRRFIASNAQVFHKVATLEARQTETEKRVDRVLNALESREILPRQGIFYDGQIFDAYRFVSDLFRSAKKSIVIIDNFIDDTVLTHLTKRSPGVRVTILTRAVSRLVSLDIAKFNSQYPGVEIKEFGKSHDRFVIIDGTHVYHVGASLKDLGRKWFAFTKMELAAAEMLHRLNIGSSE